MITCIFAYLSLRSYLSPSDAFPYAPIGIYRQMAKCQCARINHLFKKILKQPAYIPIKSKCVTSIERQNQVTQVNCEVHFHCNRGNLHFVKEKVIFFHFAASSKPQPTPVFVTLSIVLLLRYHHQHSHRRPQRHLVSSSKVVIVNCNVYRAMSSKPQAKKNDRPCGKCRRNVTPKRDPGISCIKCNKFWHFSCINLSKRN